jgi:hypothetical protein
MKKMPFLFLLVVASITCFAQGDKKKEKKNADGNVQIDEAQVPDAVKNALTLRPADLRWEKRQSKNKEGKIKVRYVAVYSQDSIPVRSRFKEDGTALSSSRYLEPQQLPAAVQSAATKKHSGAKLMGGEEVTTKKRNVYYRVRLRNGGTKIVSFYDANGIEVKKDRIDEYNKEVEMEEN